MFRFALIAVLAFVAVTGKSVSSGDRIYGGDEARPNSHPYIVNN